MIKEEKMALNKKLAEWLYPGPKYRVAKIELDVGGCFGTIEVEALYTQEARSYINSQEKGLGDIKTIGKYYYLYSLPIFTDSLDACFKVLVPKLDDWTLEKDKDAVIAGVWLRGIYENDRNINPALAFCLAVEKIINKETNDKHS